MMLPVVHFIAETLGVRTAGEARAALVERLAGRPEKRRRLVDRLFDEGRASANFRRVLASRLGCDPEALERAYARTRRALNRAAWLEFFDDIGPHFHVETSGSGRPLFAAAMAWRRFKILPVPELARLDGLDEKLDYAAEWIARYAHTAPRGLPAFGKVSGYTLYPDADHAFAFDADGRLIGPTEPDQSLPAYRLSVAGREFPEGLWEGILADDPARDEAGR